MSFEVQKLILMKSSLKYVAYAFGVVSHHTLPNSGSWRFTPVFSVSCMVLAFIFRSLTNLRASQMALMVNNLPANAEDVEDKGSIAESGRSPGEGNGSTFQYSCLENPWAENPGRLQSMGSQSQTQLKQLSMCASGCPITVCWRACFPSLVGMGILVKGSWLWVYTFISRVSVLFAWSVCLSLCQ